PDHGGEFQGQRTELETFARRDLESHKSGRGRGTVQRPQIFHDKSEPVGSWQIAQRVLAAQPYTPPRPRLSAATPPWPPRKVVSTTGRPPPSSTSARTRYGSSSTKASPGVRPRSSTKR